MPKYKGTCGCYNKDDARQFGLVPAIVWNDMLDRSEHFNTNPMWYDQKDASERLGIEYHRVNRAVKTLEDLGRITTKGGYRPKSSVKTTWVTINDVEISNSNFRNEQNEISRNEQNENPILKETNNDTTTTGCQQRMKPSALRDAIAREFKKRPTSPTQSRLATEKLQEQMSDDDILRVIKNRSKGTFTKKDGTTWEANPAWVFNPNNTGAFVTWASNLIEKLDAQEELTPWDQKRYDLAIKLGVAQDYDDCRDNWGMILPKIISTPEYRELENDR